MVLVDNQKIALGAAGRMADRWPATRTVSLVSNHGDEAFDGVARVGPDVFRVISVPLVVDDATIGALYVATSLDQRYAEELDRLAGTRIAIVSEGLVQATTLPTAAAHRFESAVAGSLPLDGTLVLDGESYAFRRLVAVGFTGS